MIRKLSSRKSFVKEFSIFLMFILLSVSVFAHAKLEKSSPQKDEVLNKAPKTVELFFSVAIQSSGINSVIVTDENGKRVDKNDLSVSDDDKRLTTGLNELSSGAYKVDWRAISTDDHTIKGEYTFTVKLSSRGNGKETTAGSSEETKNIPAGDVEKKEDHSHHATEESATSNWQSVVRWFVFSAMFLLFGGFAFRLFVLKPTLNQTFDLTDEERSEGFEKSRRRFVSLLWLGIAVLALAVPARLLLQTSSVFGTGFTGTFSPSKASQVLTQTGFGTPWIVQAVVVILLFVVVFLISRKPVSNENFDKSNPLLWTGLILGAILLLTPSLTGHARAASKDYLFAIPSDWIHMLAGSLWVGGLVHLFFTSPKAFENFESATRLDGVIKMIPLFSRLAIAATILIVLTGIYNSWIHLASFYVLFSTDYGITLLIKILLVIPMIALGGVNSFILHPQMKQILADKDVSQTQYQQTSNKFYRSVSIEVLLGILVLVVVSILTFLPPGK